MSKYLTRTFIFMLDLWGILLIKWTVKSKDGQAFLPDNEAHFSMLIES